MPPKQNDSSFLFVNRNEASFTTPERHAGEKADILSHVQTRRRRAAKASSGSTRAKKEWLPYTSVIALGPGQRAVKGSSGSAGGVDDDEDEGINDDDDEDDDDEDNNNNIPKIYTSVEDDSDLGSAGSEVGAGGDSVRASRSSRNVGGDSSRASSSRARSRIRDDTTIAGNVSSSAGQLQPKTFQLYSRSTTAAISPPSPPILALPGIFPTDNASDPFHSTVAGHTPSLHQILAVTVRDAVRTVHMANAFAPEAIVTHRQRPMRHDGAVAARLRRCVSDPMLMNATLAYGMSVLRWLFGPTPRRLSTGPGAPPPPEYFVGNALAAVRRRLAEEAESPVGTQAGILYGVGGGEDFQRQGEEAERGQVVYAEHAGHAGHHLQPPRHSQCGFDVWLFISIHCLAIVDQWNAMPAGTGAAPDAPRSVKRAHLASSRVHIRALARLMAQAGGWRAVPRYALESLILSDIHLAVAEQTPPIVPADWDPGAFPLDMDLEAVVPRGGPPPMLGRRLLSTPMADNSLRTAVADAVGFVVAAVAAWEEQPEVNEAQESWLFLRQQAVVSELLRVGAAETIVESVGDDDDENDDGNDDNADGGETNTSRLGPVDECIRLAVLASLFAALGYVAGRISAACLARRMRRPLEACTSALRRYDPPLLLWCLCVAGMAAEAEAAAAAAAAATQIGGGGASPGAGASPGSSANVSVAFSTAAVANSSRLAEQILLLCRDAGIQPSEAALRRQLEPFLFLPGRHGASLALLVRRIAAVEAAAWDTAATGTS